MKKTMMCAALLLCMASTAVRGAEVATLGGGARLELSKKGLTLIDGGGIVRASLPMRASQLDVRATGGAGLAVVLDSATQHAQLLRFDAARGTLAALAPLPVQAFGVESLCLFRDRQQIDQLFIAGRDGQAEQWLLQGDQPQLVRKLSLPVDAAQCKVDDSAHALYVDEDKVGTWAYEADSEAPPARALLKRGRKLARSGAAPAVLVQARVQTESVARLGDVADDPAIWVNHGAPASSRVLGTNKKQGLMVYDMQGKQQQFLASGRLNNVDLRQGVLFDGKPYDLAVATQRDDNTVVLYGIDGEGRVGELTRFATGLPEVYGICLFQPQGGGLDVIVNDKGGAFRQFGIARAGNTWVARPGRQFKVASQPEGCVADDRSERLFLGEEKTGVWTLAARADQPSAMQRVLSAGKELRADVEGMAIYHGARGAYLVVSSQGDSSYVVMDTQAPYTVRGRFRVGFNLAAGIDGTSETDGLDVTNADLGGAFRQGMLVIQDGYKRLPDGPQNFKYVSWADVAQALGL